MVRPLLASCWVASRRVSFSCCYASNAFDFQLPLIQFPLASFWLCVASHWLLLGSDSGPVGFLLVLFRFALTYPWFCSGSLWRPFGAASRRFDLF